MKREEIHLTDIQRLLFGQAPPEFLLEVFIRTLLVYIILLFIVRWLGKRMSGQLTIMEMSVMLTLGAIVSVPMQMPDRGIIQGVVLLLCAVAFQRGVSFLGFKNSKMEDTLQGKTSLLVKNGVLQLDQMAKDWITKQQVFAQLRHKNIYNLGMVDRVYLEACGLFSIFKSPHAKPGLSVLPPDDPGILEITQGVKSATGPITLLACINCGWVKPDKTDHHCKDCGNDEWVNAING